MAEKMMRAFVDRIEGKSARLLLGEEPHQVQWPVSELPEDALEGSVLRIIVRTDTDASRAAENEIDSIIDRLNREE